MFEDLTDGSQNAQEVVFDEALELVSKQDELTLPRYEVYHFIAEYILVDLI